MNKNEQKWWNKFNELKLIADTRGGDPNVPYEHPTHGVWLSRQRAAHRKGFLSLSRVRALEKLGVKLNYWEECWDEMFEGLKVIAAKRNGDPNVPFLHETHGHWIKRQRRLYVAKTLAADRIQALEALGVKWVMPRGRKLKR